MNAFQVLDGLVKLPIKEIVLIRKVIESLNTGPLDAECSRWFEELWC